MARTSISNGNKNKRLWRILSNDFATVDLCEEPCQTEPHEKGKSWRQKRRRKCEKTRAAMIRRRFASGSAQTPPLVAANFALSIAPVGALQVRSVAAPLPKKSLLCKFFSGALLVCQVKRRALVYIPSARRTAMRLLLV